MWKHQALSQHDTEKIMLQGTIQDLVVPSVYEIYSTYCHLNHTLVQSRYVLGASKNNSRNI